LREARKQAIPFLTMKEDRPGSEKRKLLQWTQQQAAVSRRKAKELIENGEVSVNGQTEREPSLLVDPEGLRTLSLRGQPLPIEPPELRIYRYHKIRDTLCSHDDPHEGNTLGRVLRAEGFIGYTWAGRLDQDAEGLLVVSNDGQLIHAFTHPSFEVPKTYRVWLAPPPNRRKMESAFDAMQRGIEEGGDRLRILEGRLPARSAYAQVTLAEGKKHEVKRLFAHFGYRVTRLLRIRVGQIELGDLPPGSFSRLSREEEAAAFASAQILVAGR